MSNDLLINDSVVVGLQRVAVSDETPTDGYVLTYDSSGDGYWGPKPIPSSGGLRKEYFTSNGTWTCPEGVTNILVIAAGGGGGGQGGGASNISFGGGGAIQQTSYISVSPGHSYSIVIGVGGNGGTGGTGGSGTGPSGSDGSSTTISYSSSIIFSASGAAGGNYNYMGNNIAGLNGFYNNPLYFIPGAGGGFNFTTPLPGNKNYLDMYNGGVAGTSGASLGGSGGGAGPQGNGGNGGTGGASGTNGQSASNNSGAGGGAGGNYFPPNTGGVGGNGGSGYLYIIY